MPIAALSQDTARVLTSSVALNDAVSVVKELVDNALDAAATSITIEISNNTIDTIQVKDNGKGIGIEDRQLLCKKGCTSKIRTIEDLNTLGGRSLGFRGEALASTVNISGAVLVTTRIEGETVGTTLKFGAGGIMLSSSSASHAVGTTVRVQDFLSNVPVRKQTVLKSTTKVLTNVRKLLLAYAFARPEVRYTFKVLKGKNDKSNWNYAPSKASSTMIEDVTKIIGKEAAAQLLHHNTVSEKSNGHNYIIDVLLIRPDSDIAKACNMESYFSVDQRPVNADRDLMKDLHKLYKKYLRHALHATTNDSPTKPFMCLRLSCPPESYDINVEPAKDRVMFYGEPLLHEIFEGMLKEVYGVLPVNSTDERHAASPLEQGDTFNVLMARPRPNVPMQSVDAAVPGRSVVFPSTQVSEEQCESQQVDEPDESESSAFDSPWTKAKINVRINRDIPGRSVMGQGQPDVGPSSGITHPDHDAGADASTNSPLEGDQLPTPAKSSGDLDEPYQNPGPPMRRPGPRVSDSEPESPPPTIERGPTLLEGWIKTSQQIRARQSSDASLDPSALSEATVDPASKRLPFNPVSDPVSSNIQETQTGTVQSSSHAHRDRVMQKPFISPFKRPRLSQFPSSSPTPGASALHPRTVPANSQSPSTPVLHGPLEAELDEILEFERQKKAVMQQRKLTMRAARKSQAQESHVDDLYEGSQQRSSQSRPGTSSSNVVEDFESQFSTSGDGDDAHRRESNQQHSGSLVSTFRRPQRVSLNRSARDEAVDARGHDEPTTRFPEKDRVPKLADTDPRACLIRQKRSEQEQQESLRGGFSRTGLRIRRTKTSRLPLETIPVGAEVHDLCTDLPILANESRDTWSTHLRQQLVQLSAVDEYVKLGQVDTVTWGSRIEDIEEWKSSIDQSLKQNQPTFDADELDLTASMKKAFQQLVDD